LFVQTRGLFEDEDEAVVIQFKSKSTDGTELLTSVVEGSDDDQWEDDDGASDDDDEEDIDDDDDDDDDDEEDEDDDDDDFSMEDESVDGKAKTALTSYSMSSSVMPRNAGLTLLDDRFEKVIVCSNIT